MLATIIDFQVVLGNKERKRAIRNLRNLINNLPYNSALAFMLVNMVETMERDYVRQTRLYLIN